MVNVKYLVKINLSYCRIIFFYYICIVKLILYHMKHFVILACSQRDINKIDHVVCVTKNYSGACAWCKKINSSPSSPFFYKVQYCKFHSFNFE